MSHGNPVASDSLESLAACSHLVKGFPLIVYTDHKNNLFTNSLLGNKRINKKLLRWSLDLEEYGERVQRIVNDLENSDVVLVGISRTSKTPTSIYLANRGYKVSNIPIVTNKNLSEEIIKNINKTYAVGLICDVNRLSDVRRNRIQSLHEDRSSNYTEEETILIELENSKKLFKKHNWPIIDVTRKSVEETAASIIKILDILNSK